MGGKFHLKLNTGSRPIAKKYREGKMKRTLKRELKVLEIAKREPVRPSVAPGNTACAVSACVRCSGIIVPVSMGFCCARSPPGR